VPILHLALGQPRHRLDPGYDGDPLEEDLGQATLRDKPTLTFAARLRQVVTRPFVKDIAVFAVVAVLTRALLALAIRNPPGAAGEFALGAISLLVGLSVAQAMRWWQLRGFFPELMHLQEYADPPARSLIRALVRERLDEISGFAESLTRDRYDVTAPETVAPWVDTLFQQGGLNYKGVDTHSPSHFLKAYSWYLDLHARALSHRSFQASRHIRIMCASPESLRADYSESPDAYLQFFEWHAQHDVELRLVDPWRATALRDAHGLGTADVALWSNFAVLFELDPQGRPLRIGIRFPGSGQGSGPTYDDIRAFVNALEAESVVAERELPSLAHFDPTLADHWASYVDVDRRTDPRGPVGAFLLSELNGRQMIFDAAAGVGCESVLLLRHGFSVFSNELDSRLARHAVDFASSWDVRLNMTTFLWEDLARSLSGNLRFDAVLVLGNSLSLVQDKKRRAQCLQAFWDILLPGGVLIIDERNYSVIDASAEAIRDDPLGAFPPATQGDVMYAGTRIRGYPASISAEKILWDFFVGDEGRSGRPSHHLGSAPLVLYPFGYGELFHGLERIGFAKIRVFGDLQPLAVGEMPPEDDIATSDFLTYVAEKPRSSG
jgi:SAM-dependent methyltransferase